MQVGKCRINGFRLLFVFIEGFVNLFSFVMNLPVEKLEKVGILLDLGLECTQILRYRDAFMRNRDVSEGF